MKVFLLRPNPNRDLKESLHDDQLVDPFSGYDVQKKVVVRAKNESEAREIAEENAGDEGFWKKSRLDEDEVDEYLWYDGVWTNHNLALCEELTGEGERGVVIRDYKNG